MAAEFKTFMSFTEPEMANEIAGILAEGKVLYNIYDTRKDFDPAMSNSEMGKEILIQIRQQDFKQAEMLLDEKMPLDIDTVDPSHFLFGFTDEELKDVVKRTDEWHILDIKLAKYLLQQKGITVSEEEMDTFRAQDLIEKAKPEKIEAAWLVIAYMSAICLGFFGLLIGWYLATLKKTLPDGSKVYNYGRSDRRHGKLMLMLGSLSMMIMILYLKTKYS